MLNKRLTTFFHFFLLHFLLFMARFCFYNGLHFFLYLFGNITGFGETVSTRKQQFEGKNPLQQKEVQPKYFEGKCDEPNGRYAVSGQCDAYVECQDGVSEEKLCPDGLLFNDKVGIFTFPCQYPIDVDCTQRTKTQSAQVILSHIKRKRRLVSNSFSYARLLKIVLINSVTIV